jgi:HJR/Mrr/RecB family endonuclease
MPVLNWGELLEKSIDPFLVGFLFFFKPPLLYLWLVPLSLMGLLQLMESLLKRHLAKREERKDNQRFDSIRTTEQLLKLSPREFERYVARLFDAAGYTTELTPRSNDKGIDIWATKGDFRVIVQCKRYTDKAVGREYLDKLYGVLTSSGADHAYMVTTSRFSKPAIEFARSKTRMITLVDRDVLADWAKQGKMTTKGRSK